MQVGVRTVHQGKVGDRSAKRQIGVLSIGPDQRPDEAVAERVTSNLKEPTMIRTAPTVFALTALGLIAIAQPVSAQSPQLHSGYSHDPSKVVTYTRIDSADIDPDSAAGARILLQRIEAAADAVCGGQAKAVSKSQKRDYADCRSDAVAGAVSKMGAPALKQLAANRRRELLAAR
jgi:UrcA family protein